jgi:NDP-sugar pyrophosphorylase family protein
VGDGESFGVRARYSWETPVLGSAGGPRRAVPILGGSPFLIVNGDTLTSVDLTALVEAHRRSGALVTMAVVPNTEPQKYSGIITAADGRFAGVARRGAPEPSFHYVGVQVANAEAFASVPADTPYESVGALYPALAAAHPGAVRVFPCDAEFHDIGTPLDYFDTSMALAGGDASLHAGTGSQRSPQATVQRSIVWDDVRIGDGADLSECIVTDGVVIPPGTSWRRMIIRRAKAGLLPAERAVNGLAVSALS